MYYDLYDGVIFVQELSDKEVEKRRREWVPPDKPVKGLLAKYRRSVSSAHTGAVTH